MEKLFLKLKDSLKDNKLSEPSVNDYETGSPGKIIRLQPMNNC